MWQIKIFRNTQTKGSCMYEEIQNILNSVSATIIYFRIVLFSLLTTVIAADSEDALQISIHKMKTVTSKYGLKVSR